MSDVFSFRLSDQNPREAQAKEVIEAWVRQGYSLRQILTEAILLLGNNKVSSMRMDDMSEIVERLSRLVDRLDTTINVKVADYPTKVELNTDFISSIKTAIKPGIRNQDNPKN